MDSQTELGILQEEKHQCQHGFRIFDCNLISSKYLENCINQYEWLVNFLISFYIENTKLSAVLSHVFDYWKINLDVSDNLLYTKIIIRYFR